VRPDRDCRATTEEKLARTVVYRIEIEHWSGKAEEERPNFPDAFHYWEQAGK